ncbi:DUF3226 domain-containing protein [Sphingomonas aerolata]|uniref:DUF3226 domain-containing protein n=1 Tax=Sphingomonas aerolata TaxID=185951 RepID=UPI0033574DEB
MSRYLMIVEGPHDASMSGVVLLENGFHLETSLQKVDPYWQTLIPKVFPSGTKLGHVVQYPDVYVRDQPGNDSCAVIVAGGDSRLLSEMRVALEILDGSELQAISIIADADDFDAQHRFDQLVSGLTALNASHGPGGTDGGSSGLPAFPLTLPSAPGRFSKGNPNVGIYVMPDNNGPGTLDALLLECAVTSLPEIYTPACQMVATVDAAIASSDSRFKLLRKPSGKEKASAGVIANLLFPGAALSVAVGKGAWFGTLTGTEKGISTFRAFVADLLK